MPAKVANPLVLSLSVALPVLYISFWLLRKHQLSLAEPYDNTFTDLSTTCLLLFLIAWIFDLTFLLCLNRKLTQSVLIIAWTLIGFCGLLVAQCLLSAIMHLFPGVLA